MIYLTGPVASEAELELLDKFQLEMQAHTLDIISVADVVRSYYNHRMPGELLRHRITAMMSCDAVATTWDWHNCQFSVKEVDVARICDIPVKIFIKFLNREGAGIVL